MAPIALPDSSARCPPAPDWPRPGDRTRQLYLAALTPTRKAQICPGLDTPFVASQDPPSGAHPQPNARACHRAQPNLLPPHRREGQPGEDTALHSLCVRPTHSSWHSYTHGACVRNAAFARAASFSHPHGHTEARGIGMHTTIQMRAACGVKLRCRNGLSDRAGLHGRQEARTQPQ